MIFLFSNGRSNICKESVIISQQLQQIYRFQTMDFLDSVMVTKQELIAILPSSRNLLASPPTTKSLQEFPVVFQKQRTR